MSKANFQFEKLEAYKMDETTVATTHSVKTGRVADTFKIENPIKIVDPADDFTITVSNGVYAGQKLLIYMSSNGNSKTATISATVGDDCTLDTAGDYISYEWIDSTTGWQEVHSEKAS